MVSIADYSAHFHIPFYFRNRPCTPKLRDTHLIQAWLILSTILLDRMIGWGWAGDPSKMKQIFFLGLLYGHWEKDDPFSWSCQAWQKEVWVSWCPIFTIWRKLDCRMCWRGRSFSPLSLWEGISPKHTFGLSLSLTHSVPGKLDWAMWLVAWKNYWAEEILQWG